MREKYQTFANSQDRIPTAIGQDDQAVELPVV
jgi:hypothetical protein